MKPLCAEIREKIILLRKQKRNICAISNSLCVSKSAVGAIIKQYEKSNLISTNYAGHCGRKSTLDSRDLRKLYRASVADPGLTARNLQKSTGGHILSLSVRSVQRYLIKIDRLSPIDRKKSLRGAKSSD